MPFPCHAAPPRFLDCVFPIWFTQCGRVWFTHAMAVSLPCHDHAVLKATSQDHGTARGESGMGTAWYTWISIGRPETVCVRPARVRLLPAITRSSTKVLTWSRLEVRIFPSTTRAFLKEKALSENGRVTAWHVWINTAGEQHGTCELAFTVFLRSIHFSALSLSLSHLRSIAVPSIPLAFLASHLL
jgi:hypothetical protein